LNFKKYIFLGEPVTINCDFRFKTPVQRLVEVKFDVNCDSAVEIIASAPYRYTNRLSCVGCSAGTISKTHAKAEQHHAELKDRFVVDTE